MNGNVLLDFYYRTMTKIKRFFVNFILSQKTKAGNVKGQKVKGLICLFGKKEAVISINRDFRYIKFYRNKVDKNGRYLYNKDITISI